jgi:hypothetical protein
MRYYRDWQFFNRKPEGSDRLMQACYSGLLWDMGFGFSPARMWIGRFMKDEGKYCFHLHIYLPFARRWKNTITYTGRVSIGWRRNGVWRQLPKK